MKKLFFIIILMGVVPDLYGQSVALKTNLLYWATTTPNASVEVALNDRFTLDIAGTYNAWDFKKGMSLKHYLFQPELRYWIACKPFEGHFVGVHAHYGHYNIGEVPFISALDTYKYRGHLAGTGLSYGYHWVLADRWGLEATIGLGYTRLQYKKYLCVECAELMGEYRRNFLGPTKIGVSIIYVIK